MKQFLFLVFLCLPLATTHAQESSYVDGSDRIVLTTISSSDDTEKDMVSGDFNNDGWEDIIVVRKETFTLPGAYQDILLMNEGGTLIDRTETYAPGFLSEHTDARDVNVADFDGDGWLDVVIANTYEDQPNYYRNLGESEGQWLGFVNESALRIPEITGVDALLCAVAIGDVNGDGHLDLFLANYIPLSGITEDFLYINDGNGFFTDESTARLGVLLETGFSNDAQIVDMDGDGDLDIVKHMARGMQDGGVFDTAGAYILFNEGDGTFDNVQNDLGMTSSYMITTGDYNNDSKTDLYVVLGRETDFLFTAGDVTPDQHIDFTSTSLGLDGPGGNVKTYDFDSDGDLDIAVTDVDIIFPETCSDDNLFMIHENNGQGEFTNNWDLTNPMADETGVYDFVMIDVNRDGVLDLFAGTCGGYRLVVGVDASNPNTLVLGDLGDGVVATDNRTGSGYIMYSEENVHDRFAGNWHSFSAAANHLVAVVFENGQWKYDENETLVNFTPRDSDRLVAEVDFSANTVNHLDGVNTIIEGINAGYASGDLVITPEIWDGGANEGEFSATGSVLFLFDEGGNTAPVLASIGNQIDEVNGFLSLLLNATDAEDDALSFSVSGLPGGLSLSGSTISGVPNSIGTFTTTATVEDSEGATDSETFTWTITSDEIVETETIALGNLGIGIVATDSRTGTGYIMYSEENVHNRFSANWHVWEEAADHLIPVVFENGQWKYDQNETLIDFTPRESDRLFAEVDFSADTVNLLEGDLSVVEGVNAGYSSGDLAIIANWWNGVSNDGEFAASGTEVIIETGIEPSPVEEVVLALGDLNLGVAAHDPRTGSGYIMYSDESIHTRFADTPTSQWAADHLIAVVFDAGEWKIDRNKSTLVAFTPRTTDHLLAEIDFGANTASTLDGLGTVINGINAGYTSGDLVVTPEWWGNGPDVGEFGISGIQVTVNGEGLNSSPVLAAIGDQTNDVHDVVSLPLSATDSDGDALTYAVTGLPDGLSLSGNIISGTLAASGVYDVIVTVEDGKDGMDTESFTWIVSGGDVTATITLSLGDLNLGIAAHDDRTGTGYIMYSAEPVHTRFEETPPSVWNADHLIAVVFEGGQWKVDRNKRVLESFTPLATDQLVASVDFGANTVTHLEGSNTSVEGINAGYVSGDLVIEAEMWGGSPNAGEFGVTGTEIEIPSEQAQAQARDQEMARLELEEVPEVFELGQNYPNPFNPVTTIRFSVAETAQVQLAVFDMLGRQVATLVDGSLVAGKHEYQFQAGDLPSGTYMYRLTTPEKTFIKQMILLK